MLLAHFIINRSVKIKIIDNMKKLIFVILVFGFCGMIHAQQTKKDNYSFMKLLVTNDKGEVLLLGDDLGMEITGTRYNDTLSVKECVNWMADRMGIQVKNIKLRGLVTFYYTWRDGHPTLMHYYTAEYESGNLVLPKGCDKIEWVDINKSGDLIPYDEMNKIISKIRECDYLFGGSFRIWKNSDTGKRESQFIEPFYRLN